MTWAGSILSIVTEQGAVHNLLTHSGSVLSACYGGSVAHMSSLKEVTVSSAVAAKDGVVKIPVAIEPAFLALGSHHVVVGMNNYAWFYSLANGALLCEKEYTATIEKLCVTASAAAILGGGFIQVHQLEGPEVGHGRSARFPDASADGNSRIVCMSVSPELLVWGDSSGSLVHFLLEEWTQVNEYRHSCGIVGVWGSASAMRLVMLDDARDSWLYNPLNDQRLPIPNWPANVSNVLWDLTDSNIFVAVSSTGFSVYSHAACTVAGPAVTLIGVSDTSKPSSVPMVLQKGIVFSLEGSGILDKTLLTTHKHLRGGVIGQEQLDLALKCQHHEAAANICASMATDEAWKKFASTCLQNLEIEMATRGYRELGDAAMVLSLQKLLDIEDKNLLAGTVAMINGDFSRAEKLFWSSSQPIRALEMRQDLLQWEEALRLAALLDESQVCRISCAYAQQLEHQGEHSRALELYDQCLSNQGITPEQARICRKGMVRTTLLTGDSARGVALGSEMVEKGLVDKGLIKECAQLLEGMRQLNEAAMLYERAGLHEKAVSIYIAVKNFSSAGRLMEFVNTPKLQLGYAKAKESEGKFADAVVAYRKGKDMDSVVRLLLHDKLDRPAEAFEVVRETENVSGAKMAADYCEKHNNYSGAIEFLLFAKEHEKAFELATMYDAMEVFTKQLGDKGTKEQWLAIANYYEGKNAYGLAGNFYAKCGMPKRAVELYLRSGSDEHIQAAIEVVGSARDEELTGELIDYLVGERDGIPKEPSHIFKL